MLSSGMMYGEPVLLISLWTYHAETVVQPRLALLASLMRWVHPRQLARNLLSPLRTLKKYLKSSLSSHSQQLKFEGKKRVYWEWSRTFHISEILVVEVGYS